LYRFTYNAGTKTYTLDSGFPVNVNTGIVDGVLTGGKTETLVLAKDSTGTLWVTYVENGFVIVNHSHNGNDLTWATPSVLPAAHADVGEGGIVNGTVDDISSIIAYNGHVGIMWSRQTYNSSVKNHQPASGIDRADGHDSATTPFQHRRQRGTRRSDGRHEVQVQRRQPLVVGDVRESLEPHGNRPHVVHEDVEPAELLRVCDQRLRTSAAERSIDTA
jgi:hypothetical protein